VQRAEQAERVVQLDSVRGGRHTAPVLRPQGPAGTPRCLLAA
jgi:hypothetical protein